MKMWWLEQKQPACDQDEPASEEGKREEWKGPEPSMGYWDTEPDLGHLVKQ